jgi:hypothetical protein
VGGIGNSKNIGTAEDAENTEENLQRLSAENPEIETKWKQGIIWPFWRGFSLNRSIRLRQSLLPLIFSRF